MSIKCCDFLLLKEGSVGAVALDSFVECEQKVTAQSTTEAVKSLFSLSTMGLTPYLTADFQPKQQQEKDIPSQAVNMILSLGFQYQIFPSWRDKTNCSRFGYNNNYVSLMESDEVNFGYISFRSWIRTMGKLLPFDVVKAALEKNSCFLPANDSIQAEVCGIVREAWLDWGLGVILVRKSANGNWQKINSSSDRQISDISDLEDDSRLVQEIPISNAHYDLINAVTVTYISRPEDTKVARNDLYINFTLSSSEHIFQGSKGEGLCYYCNDPAPLGDCWQMITTLVSFGFAHPDNFLVNRAENVWMMTDISTLRVNNAVKSRTDNKGISADLTGVFKNAMWYIITSSDASKALLFDTNLMECETNCSAEASFRYFLTPYEGTMFLSIDHLWETLGYITQLLTYSTLQVNEVHPLPLARGGLGRGISVPHKVEICCIISTNQISKTGESNLY
ncbi:MAG: hypothetical protein KME60_09820 [Cyanomargarita calcarea GSE-NOS-MK-12-04C]|jgi:hypothetical protein|uniref:Uncharacterized protein n=1 Tax=Cyanomargarita calcarea GSE-NOS-MK-12-04C TaxID=2839659 RepID=A0A951QKR9_9CYAN|nr:hypothetical protein [Cyanomargarita calcarea GSE-NOS-MK-12-04C]